MGLAGLVRDESKTGTGYGITGLLIPGCGIKIFLRPPDLIILENGMRDSLKVVRDLRLLSSEGTTLKNFIVAQCTCIWCWLYRSEHSCLHKWNYFITSLWSSVH